MRWAVTSPYPFTADVPFTVKRGRVTTESLDMVGSGMDLRLGGEAVPAVAHLA